MNKKRNKIYIEKYIKKEIRLDFIYKDYLKMDSKDGRNRLNTYTNSVSKYIRGEIKELRKKYKNINFNMQTNNIIIRNIRVLNIKNKKDIESMIEFEITQYMPINIKDYMIKYKVLSSEEKDLNLQVILMPKYMLYICNEIAYMLNMKPKNININFDILQKIIALGLIENFEKQGLFIENKDNEFILNKVKDNIIFETYTLPQTIQSYESVDKLSKEHGFIYYYGVDMNNDIGLLNQNSKLKKLELIKNIKIELNKSVIKSEKVEHINSIGMVI